MKNSNSEIIVAVNKSLYWCKIQQSLIRQVFRWERGIEVKEQSTSICQVPPGMVKMSSYNRQIHQHQDLLFLKRWTRKSRKSKENCAQKDCSFSGTFPWVQVVSSIPAVHPHWAIKQAGDFPVLNFACLCILIYIYRGNKKTIKDESNWTKGNEEEWCKLTWQRFLFLQSLPLAWDLQAWRNHKTKSMSRVYWKEKQEDLDLHFSFCTQRIWEKLYYALLHIFKGICIVA